MLKLIIMNNTPHLLADVIMTYPFFGPESTAENQLHKEEAMRTLGFMLIFTLISITISLIILKKIKRDAN